MYFEYPKLLFLLLVPLLLVAHYLWQELAERKPHLRVSTVRPSICHEVMEPDDTILAFLIFNFKPAFSLPSFILKRLFSSSSLSAISPP